MLDVVVGAWSYFIEQTGVPLDPLPVAIATIGIAIIARLLWSMRKSRREFQRIASELEKATAAISDHMRVEFDSQIDKMSKLQASVQGTINRRFRGVHDKFEALHELLRPTEAVTSLPADTDINGDTGESNGERVAPRRRLHFAQSVRSSVVEKWLEGMTFHRSTGDANVYCFDGHNETEDQYRIVFYTPYRFNIGDDGRMPFALDIWVNGRKHLNFEWDSEGKYALRGFKRGEWVHDVSEWRLYPGTAVQVA